MNHLPFISEVPELLSQWDFEKNTDINPDEITLGSNIKVWWVCPRGHNWRICPNLRNQGNGCVYCANKKVLSGYNDLATSRPDLAAQWDHSKNGALKPEDVLPGTPRKVWWICQKGHSWETPVSARTSGGRNCPYCSGQRVIPGINDLATLYPDLAREWNYEKNNGLLPTEVMPGSQKKVWWLCGKGHQWQAVIHSRRSHGCPVCSGRKVEKGKNDLLTILPETASEWDYEKNNGLTPGDVCVRSNRHFWWICKKGHKWKATPADRYAGYGCPFCKGQIKMRTYYMS